MNKKTTILGLIAVVALAGIIWHFSREIELKKQAASILNDKTSEEQQPEDPAVSVDLIEDEFILGSPDAPVAIIDYSSHLCGHCISFHQETLPLLVDKYVKTGQVKITPRLLSPIELSMAVLCGQEQEKFRETNDYLFEHVGELESIDDLKAIADQVGLNKDNFGLCVDSNKYEDRIAKWFEQAKELEVEGTPTFIINGQKIMGNQPFSVFEEIIEEELANN